jgi:hypothetical protein
MALLSARQHRVSPGRPRPRAASEEHCDDGFALYQLKVDLEALGPEKKPIQNISFKKAAGCGPLYTWLRRTAAPGRAAGEPVRACGRRNDGAPQW